MNGVIWDKMQKIFVPISNVPAYAMMQQERFKQNRALENHNFQLQNLTLTSFQEPNFFEFYDNDTKVTGLCGDLWTLLSESLNFTLQPIRSNVNSAGVVEKNQTYINKLLDILFRNETIAIPKIETYSSLLTATDFTMPLWINSYRTYIRLEEMHDITWMAKVFSWKVWCIILVMHVTLSICSFWSQIILTRIENKYKNTNFGEHFFYNFGMLCNQSYVPEILYGRSKILEISLGLFCSILYMAFGAVLFIYMTKNIIIPPFDNLQSLVTHTRYKVITLKGSVADIAFKISPNRDFVRVRTAKRVVFASTIEEMFETICSSTEKKYTVIQGEDAYKATNTICKLTPVGESYLNMWIAAGIAKNFKYKRTIDLGILKLMEVGLWDVLEERWMEKKIKDDYTKTMEAIGIDQIALPIAVMCCGTVIAFVILIIEKIVYTYKINIPQFATLQKENLAKRQALEIRDMRNEVVRAVYYEEKNMVMFYDNDTKVNGICGDLWYLLEDYLNFTFILIKINNQDFGEKLENDSYTGVVGMLTRNEAQAIMRTGFFVSRMDAMDYTTALWKFHYGLQPYYGYNNQEVIDMIRSRQLLPCPEDCLTMIYNLMIECWYEVANRRPQFPEIHHRLHNWYINQTYLSDFCNESITSYSGSSHKSTNKTNSTQLSAPIYNKSDQKTGTEPTVICNLNDHSNAIKMLPTANTFPNSNCVEQRPNCGFNMKYGTPIKTSNNYQNPTTNVNLNDVYDDKQCCSPKLSGAKKVLPVVAPQTSVSIANAMNNGSRPLQNGAQLVVRFRIPVKVTTETRVSK
ncbi:uncharacterized protein LOC114943097 [Nylanderia fulva]|uniref:uncharacterized protein LOC114943097 n=1 Tax=Nylanderia fulva TaxID=613905 RepID=UPI0010FB7AFB|nr:uncharacterized protein LOC114943097 [Nylanderia fulva]